MNTTHTSPHHDDHAHDHAKGFHDHHTHHNHDAARLGSSKVFAWAAGLNIGFVVIEVVAGLMNNSLALLADAGHNFSDVVGLLLAWGAVALAKRAPSVRYTYGLQSSTILAALGNAMLLLVATGIIVWEAAHRFAQPEPAKGLVIIAVALAGVCVNAFAAWLFMRDPSSKRDVNMRGAYLHMAADAAVSLGVALAGLGIHLTGWHWLDPAVSILIALVIVISTWGLFKESLLLALHAVPERVDAEAVQAYLATVPGVAEVHDMHIWAMSTTSIAMTAHLVMPNGHPGDDFLKEVAQVLIDRFYVDHPTLQIETSRESCAPHSHQRVHPA